MQDLPGNSGPWQQLLVANCQAAISGRPVLSLLVPVWAQTDIKHVSYSLFYFSVLTWLVWVVGPPHGGRRVRMGPRHPVKGCKPSAGASDPAEPRSGPEWDPGACSGVAGPSPVPATPPSLGRVRNGTRAPVRGSRVLRRCQRPRGAPAGREWDLGTCSGVAGLSRALRGCRRPRRAPAGSEWDLAGCRKPLRAPASPCEPRSCYLRDVSLQQGKFTSQRFHPSTIQLIGSL